MKLTVLCIGLLAGAVMTATPVRAQSDANVQPSAQDQSIRQTLVQKIEQLKYDKIQKRLELDDQQAKQFFEIYIPAEKEIQALVRERNLEIKALGAATEAHASDADIAAMTQKIADLNKQIPDRVLKLDGDLKPLLTPTQLAKLLVFEQEFNARVREQLAGRQGSTASELRKLRRQIRQDRIKEQLLKKRAAEKAAGH